MFRRTLSVGVSCAAMLVAFAGSAAAHECFNASRSDQGNAGADHSANWLSVTVEGFAHSPDFPPNVDPECFIDYWLGNGGPAGFTIRIDKTIGSGSNNPNLGDGNGIDHIETAYGALFGAALGACET